MASEILLPELGENVEGGEVVDVKVGPGAEVKEGQALLEVEAEKSTVEIPAPAPGRIAKVLVRKGDKVKTGQPLFLLEDGAAAQSSTPAPAPPRKEVAPPATPPR